MKTKKTALLFSLLIGILWSITGHARGLESRALGSRIIAANPKSVVSATFEVTNSTDRRLECFPRTLLPQGWKLITPPNQFRLERNHTTVVLLSFFIPGDARADTYEIANIFSSVQDPSISTHQTITLRVLPVTGLKVKLIEAPQTVISGQDYSASFLVVNESNQEQHVALRVSSSNNFPFTADARGLTLCAGCTHVVRVSVQTRDTVSSGQKHRIECTAFIAGKEETRASALSFVDIIPVRPGVTDRYFQVPAVLRLRQALDVDEKDTHAPFQAEVEGGGPLNEEGSRHIEFLFRGPDTLDTSAFGRRDAYYLRTWGDAYDLRLGDTWYSLSELTEQYLTARGADASVRYRGAQLRSYYAESRWTSPRVTEEAAAVGYAGDTGRFSINYLGKDREDFDERDTLLTVSTGLKPVEGMDIYLEGGSGRHLDETDNAYLAKLTYAGSRLYSRVEYIYAEPDFPGYYQDKKRLSLDLSLPVTASLQANASFDRDKDNLERNELRPIAGLDTRFQTGLNYLPSQGISYSATWLYRSFHDRMEPSRVDFITNSFRAGLIRSFSNLSFNLFGEAGRKKDRLADQEELIYEASSSLYLNLTKDQTYGAFFRYARGENEETGEDRNVTAGLNASLTVLTSTRIQCSGQVDSYLDSDIGNKYMLTASINHTFSNRSILSLLAARTFTTDHVNNSNETSLLLEYSYPFGLPAGRKNGGNSVSGVIRDAATGEAMANVLLRLDNMTAATDRDGRFIFPMVAPGVSYLNIDVSNLGFDRIPTCPNPLPVTIQEGRDVANEISITTKAVVTGRVVLYRAESGDARALYGLGQNPAGKDTEQPGLKEAAGIPNTLVELAGKSGNLRTLTDSRGNFFFREVRPGTWTVKIGTDTFPSYHGPEKNDFIMGIDPGETRDIPIKVLPRKRSIRIIEQGETIIQEKAN